MRKIASILVAACVGLAVVERAQAAPLNAPVPSNAYITMGGLDWAWANPLPAANGLDLSYQSQFGWRLPTLAELGGAPDATDFLILGGNVPFNGTDPVSGAYFSAVNGAYTSAASAGAVAVPYFSNTYSWADWQDGNGQLYFWAGLPNAPAWADQLVVRNSQAVPEAASTLALLVLALGGMAGSRRRVMS